MTDTRNNGIDYTTPFWQDTADLAQAVLAAITIAYIMSEAGAMSTDGFHRTVGGLLDEMESGLTKIENKYGELY